MNRQDRQAATAAMTKCACGNVAGLGQTQCGACRGTGHENEADILEGALGDLNVELLEAAEEVIRVWEKGDLALAVRVMAGICKQIRKLEELA